MGDVRVSVSGALKPSDFFGALTDFGPGRSAIGGNSSAGHLVVHEGITLLGTDELLVITDSPGGDRLVDSQLRADVYELAQLS